MVEAVGVEPTSCCHDSPEKTGLSPALSYDGAQIGAQILGADCPLLAQVVESWPKLSPATRAAIRTIAKEASKS